MSTDDEVRAAYERLEAYFGTERPGLPRAPAGVLRRPFVDPASVYRGQLWDWDCYFTLLALAPYLDDTSLMRDCLLNFLDHQRSDGSIPFVISTEGTGLPARPAYSDLNSAKPVLAQLALLAEGSAADWWPAALPGLRRHLEHWDHTQWHPPSGLYRWRSHRGSGADNHPGVYGRPLDATAGVDLNCLMVAELRALGRLHDCVGDRQRAAEYRARAEELANAVRRCLWDPVMSDFCHADTLTRTPRGTRQAAGWLVPLRFRSWVGFYALWAGVATDAQAAAMVAASDLFCDFGVRTLSVSEPLYNVAASANPSNWQGPVWLISNYIAFTGLRRYGFDELARRVLTGSLRLLADDLQRTGTLHEYYHPDTGEGITGSGFLNWNLLATTMYHEWSR